MFKFFWSFLLRRSSLAGSLLSAVRFRTGPSGSSRPSHRCPGIDALVDRHPMASLMTRLRSSEMRLKAARVPCLIMATYTSYGLACFRKNYSEVLLVQRRDSIEFMSFVRGNVDTAEMKEMTRAELDKLRNSAFSYLWYDLFGPRSRINILVKTRFEEMQRSGELSRRIDEVYPFAQATTAWGLPKGRKKSEREPRQDCAVREFCEETGYLPSDLVVEKDCVEDKHVGTDGNTYREVFFFAHLKEDDAKPKNKFMTKEVRLVGWFDANALCSGNTVASRVLKAKLST